MSEAGEAGSHPDGAATEPGWTAAVRDRLSRRLTVEELLPTRQPSYVGSWVYVFGVVTIAALVWVVASGCVLAFMGSAWWHTSSLGHFFNSIHFWSVQMFFIFMVLHLWGQYWGAGWRDGRAATWMVGVVIFLFSIVTAFTGYLVQQNFDSQWIAVNAKDAVNSTGLGGFFNVLNFGQMYGLHVMLLPIGVTLLAVLHILQVRSRGVVRPIGDPYVAEPTAPGEPLP
jgi:ubiquinol-cytochrome c reductase cytochrome b subunit